MNRFEENSDGSIVVFINPAITDEYVQVSLTVAGKPVINLQSVKFKPEEVEKLKALLNGKH